MTGFVVEGHKLQKNAHHMFEFPENGDHIDEFFLQNGQAHSLAFRRFQIGCQVLSPASQFVHEILQWHFILENPT